MSVCNLQTRLATARVDAQVLKVTHVHVGVDVMNSGEDGSTKSRCNFDRTIVVVRGEGTCLSCVGVGVGVMNQSDKHRQIAKKPTKDQKTAAQQM